MFFKETITAPETVTGTGSAVSQLNALPDHIIILPVKKAIDKSNAER